MERYPLRLCRGVTTLIPKEVGTLEPSKYRPITVTSVLGRIFHKVLESTDPGLWIYTHKSYGQCHGQDFITYKTMGCCSQQHRLHLISFFKNPIPSPRKYFRSLGALLSGQSKLQMRFYIIYLCISLRCC